jgi:alpha-L-rhamnosidase
MIDRRRPFSETLAAANWIWGRTEKADQYRCFRRSVNLARPARDAVVEISADSDFVLWVNGCEAGRGQFSDLRGHKTWSRFPIGEFLRRGVNILAVLVFYRGEDFSDYEAGPPGMIAAFDATEVRVVSDGQWRTALHAGFASGRCERVTLQTGFTFDYDARKEVAWREVDFDDASWEMARVVQKGPVGEKIRTVEPRPLPHLRIAEALPAVRIRTQGSVWLSDERGSTARVMAGAALRAEFPWDVFANSRLQPTFDGSESFTGLEFNTSRTYGGPPENAGALLGEEDGGLVLHETHSDADGRYFMVDLGEETVGYFEWEIEADPGTVVHVAYGEHLDDGRVRARVGGRNFADRYICGAGRRRFQMPFRRVAARFLEVHILGGKAVSIFHFGLRPVEYPAQRVGAFVTPDSLTNRIHETAVRTLELCRHEHYEDCPGREQALYAYDARLQALYGYYAFGDFRFPEVSFSLLGRTLDEEGFLALTAPGRASVNIPIFTFTWIAAVGEHWLHSGSPALFREFRPVIEKILEKALIRRDEANGLYFPPDAPQYWNFYEWTGGLCGAVGGEALQGRNFAGYNLHLHEALRWLVWMSEQAGEPKAAQKWERRRSQLSAAVHRVFWDPAAGLYRSEISAKGKLSGAHELIQALALHEGVGSESSRRKVIHLLRTDVLPPCTLSGLYYLVSPVLWHSVEARAWLTARLEKIWQAMIFTGANTLWETKAGGADFDFAGSLCHGWSALPVFYHQACLLGVRPLSPGYDEFSLGGFLSRHAECRGAIPSPHGTIEVAVRREAESLQIEAHGPKNCRPILISYPGTCVSRALYNGQAVS